MFQELKLKGIPLVLALLLAGAWCGAAGAQSGSHVPDPTRMLTSPSPQAPVMNATNVIINQVPHAGGSPLGTTVIETLDTVVVVDLFSGNSYSYDRLLNNTGSIPSPGGTNTMTGIAWVPDPGGDGLLYWIDWTSTTLYETDTAGAVLNSYNVQAPLGGLIGGLCYRQTTDTLFGNDIASDEYFEFSRTGVNTGVTIANPDDIGTGAFGNGISHGEGSGFHAATGRVAEGQVMRMYNLDALGSPVGVFWDMGTDPPGNFDSFVNGHVYTLTGSIGRPAEYIVGNASNTIFEMDMVLCSLPPITGLACVDSGGDVDLSWTNGGTYGEIQIIRDGQQIATLGGTESSYTDVAPAGGSHSYWVFGSDGAQCADGENCIAVVVSPSTTDLVFDGDTGAMDSVAALEAALTANGRTPLVVGALPPDLTVFPNLQGIWMALGIFPSNRQMTAEEGDKLVSFAQTGGTLVYVEGGDVWGFDPPTAWSDLDGAIGLDDGSDDLINLQGTDTGSGFDLSALLSTYSGENNYIDHLAADLPGAGIMWTNPDNTDDVGIYYDEGSYKALSLAFEFGGYDGDQTELAGLYLGGTCPVAAPTGLTCAATGADVDLAWMNPDPYTSVRVLRDGAEIASLAGDATSYTDTGVAPGSHQYAVVGEDSGAGCGSASDPCTVDVQPPGDQFIRGDVNADGTFNIADPVSLLSELFVPGTPPGPCADAGDVNDDGSKNIADAVSALSSLFVPGTPPPSAPHPGCGPDPSDDTLDCADFPPCP